MPELRKDPIIDRWVIISTERGKRPVFFSEEAVPAKTTICPLCPGKEGMTPPEVYSQRRGGHPGAANPWTLRVVPNKFPALRIEGSLAKEGVGLYDKMNGIGAHEVIIETPEHGETISTMSKDRVQDVLIAYRERILDLANDRRFKFVMVFKNQGSIAGASLDHSHSQLIALPIVPRRVSEEVSGSLDYYKYKERCIFCDIINQEKEDGSRIVYENESCVVLSPFASRFPFETWLLPKAHEPHYATHERKDNYAFVADALSAVLKKYDKVLNFPPYNYMIHTTPFATGETPHYHWHIEIIPRLTKMAGFEWGTGFYINPTPPEEATQFLRDAQI